MASLTRKQKIKRAYVRETIFMSDQMKLIIIASFRGVSDKGDLLVYLAIYV